MALSIYKRTSVKNSRGFVLVTMAVSAIVLFGCLGLAVDLGHMYVAKNEAQSYADAAALAGALKLDGTASGVSAALSTVRNQGNSWNFGTTSFGGTVVEVATGLGGPWIDANTPPPVATNYTYLRVTASALVPLYFMPVVTAFVNRAQAGSSVTVQALAVAVQAPQTSFVQGAFPFSPIAFDGPTGGSQATPPWGFVGGQQYTIRYASNGKSECAGDAVDSNHLKVGSSRGFWGDNSANGIGEQITGDYQQQTLSVGQVLPGVGGAKTSVASDIVNRVNQDGDTTNDVYSAYLANPAHNGRRVVVMPIQSEVNDTVLGFSSFLLLDAGSYDHTGNSNWCAIYLGVATVNGSPNPGGSGSPGVYQVRLVQ